MNNEPVEVTIEEELPPAPPLALAAMQLVSYWGNRVFPAPAPRAEVVAAAVLVAPASLRPREERRDCHDWLWAVDQLHETSVYAAALVAEVGASVLATDAPKLANQLAAASSARRRQLRRVSRFAQVLDGSGWARNCSCLESCWRLAVGLFGDHPGLLRVSAIDRGGPRVVTAERRGEDVFRLRPWPFAGPRVQMVAQVVPDDGGCGVRTVRLQRCQAPPA